MKLSFHCLVKLLRYRLYFQRFNINFNSRGSLQRAMHGRITFASLRQLVWWTDMHSVQTQNTASACKFLVTVISHSTDPKCATMRMAPSRHTIPQNSSQTQKPTSHPINSILKIGSISSKRLQSKDRKEASPEVQCKNKIRSDKVRGEQIRPFPRLLNLQILSF